MRNLEPKIYRQRLIIEAKYTIEINRKIVKKYLLDLAKELNMKVHIPEPIITSATGKGKPMHDGYEGVVFWVESGAVIYIWEKLNFLTVDIYSCKRFNNKKAVKFTSDFFKVSDVEYFIMSHN